MALEWHVVAQKQVDRFTPQGTFVEAFEVSYETLPERVQGSVTVDKLVYTPEHVRDLIDAEVAAIKGVQNL